MIGPFALIISISKQHARLRVPGPSWQYCKHNGQASDRLGQVYKDFFTLWSIWEVHSVD